MLASAGWQQSAQAEARCKRGAVVAGGARHSAPCAAAARVGSARPGGAARRRRSSGEGTISGAAGGDTPS